MKSMQAIYKNLRPYIDADKWDEVALLLQNGLEAVALEAQISKRPLPQVTSEQKAKYFKSVTELREELRSEFDSKVYNALIQAEQVLTHTANILELSPIHRIRLALSDVRAAIKLIERTSND